VHCWVSEQFRIYRRKLGIHSIFLYYLIFVSCDWNFTLFSEIQITFHEYQSFFVLSNIMREYSGIFLTSVARHIFCGAFIFFGISANIARIKQLEDYRLMIAIGATSFPAGFVIAFKESRVTQKLCMVSSQRIQQFKRSKFKYESLKAKSLQPIQSKFGWMLYTFDVRQFLTFMQYLFDKVVIFRLLYG